MGNVDPYQSLDNKKSPFARDGEPRSRRHWTLLGFLAGAALPVAFGAFWLYREIADNAPLPPGVAACGTGAVATLTVVLVIGPVGGLIGGFCGWLASGFKR